jgi:hypothetical protein
MTQFAINLGWCAFGAIMTMLLFMIFMPSQIVEF